MSIALDIVRTLQIPFQMKEEETLIKFVFSQQKEKEKERASTNETKKKLFNVC